MKQLVVVGNPIDHSLSPMMHNAALREMGLNHEYRYDKMLLQETALKKFIESIQSGLINGANITLPFKTSITSLLPNVSEEAVAVGAVNTIYMKDTEMIGSNTDVQGFLNALRESNMNLDGAYVVVIGAGGAARAIAYALVHQGISFLKLLNRSELRVEELAKSIKQHSDVNIQIGPLASYNQNRSEIDLLVNCSPVGMIGNSLDKAPIDTDLISNNTVVMDLVYNPIRTRLLKDAETVGCKTIDGLRMLVHQGALSFESWIGMKPPLDVMRKSVLHFMGVTADGT